jgi:hypothetical protein
MKSKFLLLTLIFHTVGCARVDAIANLPNFGEQIIELVRDRDCGSISDSEFVQQRGSLIRTFGR